jgi:hypothetical protein
MILYALINFTEPRGPATTVGVPFKSNPNYNIVMKLTGGINATRQMSYLLIYNIQYIRQSQL